MTQLIFLLQRTISLLYKNWKFALVLFPFTSLAIGQDIIFTNEEKEWINAHPIVHHGYEPNWPPYEIYEDGKYTGIVGDYVSIIEERTGIDFVPIPNITWEESLNKLKTGEINVVACAGITPEREKYLYFTKPYITDPLVIITRKDYPFIGGITDLEGINISLPKNYYTKELLQADYPEYRILEYNSIKESLEALSRGETDAFIGSLGVVSYYINHNGFTNLKIAAPTPYKDTKIGFAVTKDWKTLRDIAQKVFDSISQKEKNKIRENWISVRYEHSYDNAILLKLSLFILLPALFILFLIIVWNRTLKKEIRKRKSTESTLEETLFKVNRQNEEKEVLLNETHHRIKNNLQIVSSILNLQSKTTNNKEVLNSILEAGERVHSIARIHEMIYNTANLGDVNIEKYLKSLIKDLFNLYVNEKDKISYSIKSEFETFNTKTSVPLALIFNELVTNSLKYAFTEKENGEISIQIKNVDDKIEIIYKDNGTWKPPDKTAAGFGETLVEIFTEQLEGSYHKDTSQGTQYTFKLLMQE